MGGIYLTRSRRLLGNPSADLTLKGYEYAPESRGNKAGSLRQRLNVKRSVKLALLIHWFNGSINFLICNLCLLMDLMSLREFICAELTGSYVLVGTCGGRWKCWFSQRLGNIRQRGIKKCFCFTQFWIIECKCALGARWYSSIFTLLARHK